MPGEPAGDRLVDLGRGGDRTDVWILKEPIADGLDRRVCDSTLQIAQQLFVTEKTVEVHLSRTYRKLGIRSRWQLSPFSASLAAADASSLSPQLETVAHGGHADPDHAGRAT